MEEIKNKSKKEIIKDLTEQLEQINKKLLDEVSYKEMYSKTSEKLREELNEMHDIFDTLENILPRQNVKETWKDNKLSARFISYLVSKKD